jgi:hypothetical protein
MNKTLFLIAVTIFLLTSACFKDPDIRFGFDTLFGSKSQGISMMNVSSNVQTVSLKGDVVVTKGEVLVELVTPGDEPIFTRTLKSPGSMYINESYTSEKGTWKLKYNSIEGTGTLKLHLTTGN